jgi:hypothetical protein
VNQGQSGDYLGGKVMAEFTSKDQGKTWIFLLDWSIQMGCFVEDKGEPWLNFKNASQLVVGIRTNRLFSGFQLFIGNWSCLYRSQIPLIVTKTLF